MFSKVFETSFHHICIFPGVVYIPDLFIFGTRSFPDLPIRQHDQPPSAHVFARQSGASAPTSWPKCNLLGVANRKNGCNFLPPLAQCENNRIRHPSPTHLNSTLHYHSSSCFGSTRPQHTPHTRPVRRFATHTIHSHTRPSPPPETPPPPLCPHFPTASGS